MIRPLILIVIAASYVACGQSILQTPVKVEENVGQLPLDISARCPTHATSATGAPTSCRNVKRFRAMVLAASPLFGFSEDATARWPTVTYGMQRFWDSPLQWPAINTAPGFFEFSGLDADLLQAYSAGTMEGMYTLARTPPWITSQPTDTTCNYQRPAIGGGNGECFPPVDLNSDGSGTNATWKA
jgi:hypothetical protein